MGISDNVTSQLGNDIDADRVANKSGWGNEQAERGVRQWHWDNLGTPKSAVQYRNFDKVDSERSINFSTICPPTQHTSESICGSKLLQQFQN